MTSSYPRSRQLHIASSGLVALLALAHSTLTFIYHRPWGPDAVWFLGTGLGLLFLAASNLAHIGVEPCHDPTAPLIRWANWLFVLFGVGAVIAVPEPQAYLVLAGLLGQAIAARATLPGPERE